MNLAHQGSKVARSWGKAPSLRQDAEDAGVQGSRTFLRLKGSKILRLNGFRVPGFRGLGQGSMVPGFNET